MTNLSPEEIKAYEEGSASCRNYSQLTMRVRTLSQQVMVLAIAALVAALAPEEGKWNKEDVMQYGGVAISLFALSLLVVDWHYQSAFSAIRNAMAELESKAGIEGPWRAHLRARTQKRDHVASYLPFLFLWVLGWATFSLGGKENWFWLGGGAAIAIGSLWFLIILAKSAKKDKAAATKLIIT